MEAFSDAYYGSARENCTHAWDLRGGEWGSVLQEARTAIGRRVPGYVSCSCAVPTATRTSKQTICVQGGDREVFTTVVLGVCVLRRVPVVVFRALMTLGPTEWVAIGPSMALRMLLA